MSPNDPPPQPAMDPVDRILRYHERTKHRTDRYARGPGDLDWANQPDPFRRFAGAPLLTLPLADRDPKAPAAALFGAVPVAAEPLELSTLAQFLELSLGLSARKEISGSGWFLRINPSSGNLHPTEAYALLPAIQSLPADPGVYHYAPHAHTLEQRAAWPSSPPLPPRGFWIALTSITWREAWKYGERAFRYCQHDIGHALAALRFAAALLGWQVRLIPQSVDPLLTELLGLNRPADFVDAERETPELLAEVMVQPPAEPCPPPVPPPDAIWFGRANRLSSFQVGWEAIDDAIEASEHHLVAAASAQPASAMGWGSPAPPTSPHSAAQLVRQRRSAVSFDGITSLSREAFLAILDTTLPRTDVPPFDAWPLPPRLHLVLFVHRVRDLESGLYLWLRAPADLEDLRAGFRSGFDWCPAGDPIQAQPLYRLGPGDVRDFARTLSCHQDIAADSSFSLGMLARFEPTLRDRGGAAYRELFWEAGMVGQALYLAAEAAGVRGTGIGCYFDDVLHRALGLTGTTWQSLYHFTVGGPVNDPRLRTAPPYAHLRHP